MPKSEHRRRGDPQQSSAISEAAQLEYYDLAPLARRTVLNWIARWGPSLGAAGVGRLLTAYPKIPFDQGSAIPSTKEHSGYLPRHSRGNTPAPARNLPTAPSALLRLPRKHVEAVSRWWWNWAPHVGHTQLLAIVAADPELRSQASSARSDLASLRRLAHQPTDAGDHSTTPNPSDRPNQDMDANSARLCFQASCAYEFSAHDLDSSAAFTYKSRGKRIAIILNSRHSLFPFLRPVLNLSQLPHNEGPNSHAVHALAYLMAAWVKLECEAPNDISRSRFQEVREEWGRAIRAISTGAGGPKSSWQKLSQDLESEK